MDKTKFLDQSVTFISYFSLFHFLGKKNMDNGILHTKKMPFSFSVTLLLPINNLCSFPDEEIKLLQVKQQEAQTQLFKPRIYLSTRMTHHYLHHED